MMTPIKTTSVNGAGEGCGCGDFAERLKRDPARRNQQHRRNNGRRERLRLAVAVGMILVGRRRRHHQSAPDHERTENVGERLHGVGDERVGMAGNAGRELGARQHGIDGHPHEGGAQTALEPVQWHARIKVRTGTVRQACSGVPTKRRL